MNDEVVTTIEQLMQKYGFKRIEKFEDFKNLFDVTNLDEDNSPKIITTKKSLLIFDNQNFNETYLIDLINQYFDESMINIPSLNIDFFYIDAPLVRAELFTPNIIEEEYDTIDNLERNFLVPTIMIINPEEEQLTFFTESIVPFDLDSVKSCLTWLLND